jgi:hypothetical protein
VPLVLKVNVTFETQGVTLISELRVAFNDGYKPDRYSTLLDGLQTRCGTRVEFRVAETPVFLPKSMLVEMAEAGARLCDRLLKWPEYLAAARASIPAEFRVAGDSPHPHFLTADFALIRDAGGELAPRLVEIQAFPSVFAYQSVLNEEYAKVFDLPGDLGIYLSGLDKSSYFDLLRRTVLGNHSPENVVLTEVDPQNQKTLPDFLVTAKELGIAVVDISTIVAIGDKLHYRASSGELVAIHRIYNRAIADEMIARGIKLQFDLTHPWDVEWAGHPNWYFLISKFSVPWLALPTAGNGVDSEFVDAVVPPAVFLSDFLAGDGEQRLRDAGVGLPAANDPDPVYEELLLKPLFSFAGKGIQFAPTRTELEAIPEAERSNYLLQQRMRFEPTIATPHGMTQAEIRILYMWPDGGELTPALSLVRLGRGKMMGVDHNRNQEWVGDSAAFWR